MQQRRHRVRLPGHFLGNTDDFTGTIDDPAIYTTALAPTPIAAHWNAGLGSG